MPLKIINEEKFGKLPKAIIKNGALKIDLGHF